MVDDGGTNRRPRQSTVNQELNDALVAEAKMSVAIDNFIQDATMSLPPKSVLLAGLRLCAACRSCEPMHVQVLACHEGSKLLRRAGLRPSDDDV
jgi:hypothetical protein